MEFPETNWTNLALATLNGDIREKEALEQLCKDYWNPIVVVLIAKGVPRERVEDLTQDFFLQLMEKSFFKKADKNQGSFRYFILKSLRYFLADDVKLHQTKKRGGHLQRAEIKDEDVSEDFDYQQFDQAWAEVVFLHVLETMKTEIIRKRGEIIWKQLNKFLSANEKSGNYKDLASVLNISEAGAKSEVYRLRKRFREALRLEVGRTVSAPHEVNEEIAYLRSAIERMK